MLTKDFDYAREVKTRFVMFNEAFNRKISFLTGKLNIDLRKKLVSC